MQLIFSMLERIEGFLFLQKTHDNFMGSLYTVPKWSDQMAVWKYLVIILIIFIVFGAGKLPKVMEDLGRGVRLFKKGLKEEDKPKSKSKPRKKVKPLAKKSKRPAKKK